MNHHEQGCLFDCKEAGYFGKFKAVSSDTDTENGAGAWNNVLLKWILSVPVRS